MLRDRRDTKNNDASRVSKKHQVFGTKKRLQGNVLCQYLLIPKVERNCHSFSSIAKPTLQLFPKRIRLLKEEKELRQVLTSEPV